MSSRSGRAVSAHAASALPGCAAANRAANTSSSRRACSGSRPASSGRPAEITEAAANGVSRDARILKRIRGPDIRIPERRQPRRNADDRVERRHRASGRPTTAGSAAEARAPQILAEHAPRRAPLFIRAEEPAGDRHGAEGLEERAGREGAVRPAPARCRRSASARRCVMAPSDSNDGLLIAQQLVLRHRESQLRNVALAGPVPTGAPAARAPRRHTARRTPR